MGVAIRNSKFEQIGKKIHFLGINYYDRMAAQAVSDGKHAEGYATPRI